MKRSVKILFFLAGVTGLAFMIAKSGITASDWQSVFSGECFLLLMLQLTVWAVIYAIHTAVHRCILGNMPGRPGFFSLFVLTVSALAFNSATPAGMLGGESYRMLELENSCGKEKAFSSVVIMAVFYVAGHFLLWFTGSFISFLYGFPGSTPETVVMAALCLVSAAVVLLFVKKHDHGFLLPLALFLSKLPLVGRLFGQETVMDRLRAADTDFTAISRNRKQFFLLFFMEYAARLVQSFEYYLVFRFFNTGISFAGAVLVTAVSSFTANLLPVPMQVGTLEGGMLLALSRIGIRAADGIRADVMLRASGILCTAAGMLPVLFGTKKKNDVQ